MQRLSDDLVEAIKLLRCEGNWSPEDIRVFVRSKVSVFNRSIAANPDKITRKEVNGFLEELKLAPPLLPGNPDEAV